MAEDVTITNLHVGNESLRRELDDAKRQFKRFASEAERETVIRARVDTKTAMDRGFRDIEDSVDRTNRGLTQMLTRVVSIGTAFSVARRAAEGLKVAADLKDALGALSSGNLEAAEAAKAQLRKSIEETAPGQIAAQINRLGGIDALGQKLQPTRSAEAMKAAGQRARKGAVLTDEEERQMRAQEEADKAVQAAKDKRLEAEKKILAAVRRITEEAKKQADLAGKTRAQRGVVEARGDLAKFNDQFSVTPGNLAGEVGEARKALQRNVEQAQSALLDDIIDTFSKLGGKFVEKAQREAEKQDTDRRRQQEKEARAQEQYEEAQQRLREEQLRDAEDTRRMGARAEEMSLRARGLGREADFVSKREDIRRAFMDAGDDPDRLAAARKMGLAMLEEPQRRTAGEILMGGGAELGHRIQSAILAAPSDPKKEWAIDGEAELRNQLQRGETPFGGGDRVAAKQERAADKLLKAGERLERAKGVVILDG